MVTRLKRSPACSAVAAACLVKVDTAELCGGAQRELFWQQRPEARAGQPEHPTRACREVLSRGFSNAPLGTPLRSVTSSSPAGSVGQVLGQLQGFLCRMSAADGSGSRESPRSRWGSPVPAPCVSLRSLGPLCLQGRPSPAALAFHFR